MTIHFHSGDQRFCGSKETGRRFTTDPNEVTCKACADEDTFVLTPAGLAFVKSLAEAEASR